MNVFKIGDRVRVALRGEATFACKGLGHWLGSAAKTSSLTGYRGWVDDVPQPWYPHGQDAEVVGVADAHYTVKTDDGKVWPNPIGAWALTLIGG